MKKNKKNGPIILVFDEDKEHIDSAITIGKALEYGLNEGKIAVEEFSSFYTTTFDIIYELGFYHDGKRWNFVYIRPSAKRFKYKWRNDC